MKRHARVFQRPESSVWQFYVAIPPHLVHHFPHRRQFAFRGSLGTHDLLEANRRAILKDAEWVARFQALEANAEGARLPALQDGPATVQPVRPNKPSQAPNGNRPGHTPGDALDAWIKAKPSRPAKSVEVYRRAANKLAELLQGRPLEALTREDGRAFVAKLLEDADARGPQARTTAANMLSNWKTLLAQAVDLEWIDKDPLHGRSIERRASTRNEWSEAELVRLFDDPLFSAYSIPSVSKAGKDAAYWLPLLGLYTGARISELAQLGIDDLKHEDDAGWVLSIHEEGEDQSVKNQHSIRQVPVHPELVRLGLIDYRQALKDAGAARLWPAVTFTRLNGAGGRVSQWFSQYKTAKGFGPDRVFHSFRHTLQTRLLALGVPESHADTLAGRAGKTVGRKSYTHLKPQDVRPSLERLQLPGLVLPRVFKAPVWKAVEAHEHAAART